MKLKFYLIGLGTGIIVTAIIMGIALGFGGGSAEMTDEQVISRAKELGMIENTVLMPQNTTGAVTDGQNLVAGQNTTDSLPAGQQSSQPAQEVETPENAALVITGEELPAGGDSSQGTQPAGVSDGNGPAEGAGTGASAEGAGTAASAQGQGQGQQPQQGQSAAGAAQGQGTGTGAGTGTAPANGAQAGTSGAGAAQSAGQAASNDTANQGVGGSIVVTIPNSMDSLSVCEILQTAGVIDSATAFNTYLEQTGKDRYIGTGARLIPRGASYEEVSRIITGR
ncbi:MAG: hypothetical protein IJR00_13190 [Lachnospiraceae bacterium]|nr:hypothetical protein [Lachnospiraceae bacterium]